MRRSIKVRYPELLPAGHVVRHSGVIGDGLDMVTASGNESACSIWTNRHRGRGVITAYRIVISRQPCITSVRKRIDGVLTGRTGTVGHATRLTPYSGQTS